jgi:hypothetical protein
MSIKYGKCEFCEKDMPESLNCGNPKCINCIYKNQFIKCLACDTEYHCNYWSQNTIDYATQYIYGPESTSELDKELKCMFRSIVQRFMCSHFCYPCALNEAYIIWNKYKKN